MAPFSYASSAETITAMAPCLTGQRAQNFSRKCSNRSLSSMFTLLLIMFFLSLPTYDKCARLYWGLFSKIAPIYNWPGESVLS